MSLYKPINHMQLGLYAMIHSNLLLDTRTEVRKYLPWCRT